MRNPEFARNLWLELTPHRLIITPIVFLAIFYLTYKVGSNSAASQAGIYLFFFVTIIWGTRAASDALCEEINNHTWDWQRMSQLSPLQMSLGKLFGSTCFTWYAGMIALGGFAAFGMQANLHQIGLKIYILVVSAILAQSCALLLSFESLSIKTRSKRMSFHYFVGGLIIALYFASPAYFLTHDLVAHNVHWYQFVISGSSFHTVSLSLFCGWALIALYRNMRKALQFKNIPWVYGLFVVYAMVYFAGFPNLDDFASLEFFKEAQDIIQNVPLFFAFMVAIALTYYALLSDSITPLHYNKMIAAFEHKGIFKALERFPRWPIPFVLAIAAGLWLSFTRGVSFEITQQTFHFKPYVLVISTLLLVSRDCLIAHYFNFGPSMKRTNITIIFYLLLLYVLVPILLRVMHLPELAACFTPGTGQHTAFALIGPFIQVILIGYLTVTRWKSIPKLT